MTCLPPELYLAGHHAERERHLVAADRRRQTRASRPHRRAGLRLRPAQPTEASAFVGEPAFTGDAAEPRPALSASSAP